MSKQIDFEIRARSQTVETSKLMLDFPWEDRQAYAYWLAQTYQFVNHSTRLVALAAALTPFDRNEMHLRFLEHAKEERGHQLIAASDLKALGRGVGDFPTIGQATSLALTQYYWIQQQGPASLFGYILMLEMLASTAGAEVYRRVAAAHSDRAANFLRVHAEEDVGHVEKAIRQVMSLSPSELIPVRSNFEQSTDLYRSMLGEIRARLRQSGEDPAQAAA